MDHRSGRRAEFEAFVAGAAGRLLHVAVLLTAESGAGAGPGAGSGAGSGCPGARRLLAGALARTYADWRRVRGDDPYDHTRRELCAAYARTARRYRGGPGVLARLAPQERLALVLCVHEGVPEEVAAAQLGLPADRIRALTARAVAAIRTGREAA
ncbi:MULTISPECIES: sigma factor-like helix-turn-helix DNA-binding protein [Streptomyces]|uniref:sigma factor-like helix-turn-helix DNA-binding protein n=1 Tax=Streptomyces sp. 2P-4 TaxID=2931974 RepID=UPI001FEB7015|nr:MULTISPECIES: sigma factor-like helix-turn-helix DNA-binding protein [Streptomyces]